MLKANNLGDVVSAAAARVNLGVLSREQCDAVLSGGVWMDGFSSGNRIACAMTNQNIGTREYTIRVRFRVPAAHSGTGGNPSIFWLGPSASDWSSNTLRLQYDTTNDMKFDFNGAIAGTDYRRWTLTSLRSTYEGQVIDLVITRSGSTITFYVNGVVWANKTESTGGTPPAWSDSVTGSYFVLGTSSTGGKSVVYHRAQVYNVALAQADVDELLALDTPYRFRWGSVANLLTGADSDFSAANYWTNDATYPFATWDENSTVPGKGYALTPGSGSSYANIWMSLVVGKAYRLRAKVRLYAGTAIELRLGTNLGVASAYIAFTPTPVDIEYSGVIVAASTGLTFGAAGTSNGSAYEIDDVVVEAVGALIDLDLGVGKGNHFRDRSSNRLWGDGPTSGFVHWRERQSGRLVIVKTFAHSDISATAATTKLLDLPAHCGLVEVEFDRDVAFNAGTTLDVGVSGTPGKFVSGQAVDSATRVLAPSLEAVNQSGGYWTTVWVKKNQATTQGQVTLRVGCEIRG